MGAERKASGGSRKRNASGQRFEVFVKWLLQFYRTNVHPKTKFFIEGPQIKTKGIKEKAQQASVAFLCGFFYVFLGCPQCPPSGSFRT